MIVCLLFPIQNRIRSFGSSSTNHSLNSVLRAKDLPMGKSKWSTGTGVRNLIEADSNSTTKLDAADFKDVLQQVTSTTSLALYPWCSFAGMT